MLLDTAAEDARVAAAMLSGAIAVGVLHPLVADVSDDNLRSQLRRTIRRLIEIGSDNTPRGADADLGSYF